MKYTQCIALTGQRWGISRHTAPEALSDAGHRFGNRLIAQDLVRSIETDSIPKSSMYDGRAALEMILAVYESHRLRRAVELPLKNRRHPLSLL